MKTIGLALSVLFFTLGQVNQSKALCADYCVRRKEGRYPEINCKSRSTLEYEGTRYTLEDGETCKAARISETEFMMSTEMATCCGSSKEYEEYENEKRIKGRKSKIKFL